MLARWGVPVGSMVSVGALRSACGKYDEVWRVEE